MKITILSKSGIALLATVMVLGMTMGVSTVSAQAAEDGTIIAPDDVSVEDGEEKTININYSEETEPPNGIAYTLEYDDDVISVTQQKQGEYIPGIINVSESPPGEVVYVEQMGDTGNVTSDAPVTILTIEPECGIKNGASTTLEFTSAGAAEDDEDFFISTTDGSVEVEGSTSPCNGDSEDDTDSDDSSDNDDSGGGGGGGGGGVGGAGGGSGGGPTGPPTPEQVDNTLSLVEPEGSTTLTGDAGGEDTESGTAGGDSGGTSVQDITFENTNSQPIEVADYGDPPERVEEDVIDSIAADNDEIAAATDDAAGGSSSDTDDGTSETNGDGGDSESAEADVVQLVRVEPAQEISDEAQAEVVFTVDRDKVTNPNSLTVYKDAYVFEAQEEQWVEAETTVSRVTDDSVEVTTDVDEFSLFAVMEIDGGSAEATATSNADETSGETQTDDGIPGFGVGVTLIAVVILSMVIRGGRLRD